MYKIYHTITINIWNVQDSYNNKTMQQKEWIELHNFTVQEVELSKCVKVRRKRRIRLLICMVLLLLYLLLLLNVKSSMFS